MYVYLHCVECICLSTKCSLIETGFKKLRTGMEAKFRTFADTLKKVAKIEVVATPGTLFPLGVTLPAESPFLTLPPLLATDLTLSWKVDFEISPLLI